MIGSPTPKLEAMERIRTRLDLRQRRRCRLAVMGAGRQKPVFDQVPHKYRCKTGQRQADHDKNGRGQSGEAKGYEGLQYRPMNDIYAIREVSILRKVSKIAPEAEGENHPGDPENIEDLTREKVVHKKQTGSDQGDGKEMRLQLLKVEQEQYARAEIYELGWKLHRKLRVNRARVFQRRTAW